MKNDPPITLIKIPTGIWIGLNNVLANVSDTTNIVLPIIEQHGSKNLLFDPTSDLDIWGAIKPMKPIKPHTLTDEAAAKIPINAKINLHFSIDNPIDFALFSPNNIKFKGLLHNDAAIIVKIVYGNNNLTSSQDVPIKLPVVHEIAFWTIDKSEANKNKAVWIAPAIDPIMIPANTNLIGVVPWFQAIK